jgi:phosphate ABC transporter phosphate-binding protein/phosphate ABC transporter permease protein PstC
MFDRRALVIAPIILVLLGNVTTAAWAQAKTLNGAGSTFAFPLIDTWRTRYQSIDPEVSINYQSIGSGGGVKQFIEKTIDFGATDAPLTASEEQKAHNAVHIPETIGSVVVSYNLPAIQKKGLKLTGDILADIYLGKITKWNDPRIQSINPNLKLPNSSIIVAHRSDGSGTTFVWTDYLSKVSDEWHKKVGIGKSVQWPTGVGAPGNEGVANTIKGTANTIGYIELSYALSTGMPYAFLKNKEGNFIEPTFESIQAAISSKVASLPKGDQSWESVSVTDATGPNSYPIASFSYILVYKDLGINPNIDQSKAQAMVSFLSWAVKDGQQYASKIGYVPLPEPVIKLNQETISSLTFRGQPIIAIGGAPKPGLIGAYSPSALLVFIAIAGGGTVAVASLAYTVLKRKKVKQSGLEADKTISSATIAPLLSRGSRYGDRVFRFIVIATAGYTLFLVALVAIATVNGSSEAFLKEGWRFIVGTSWNPVEGRESYGALPYIIGTLASSAIAMAIGVPISLGIAVFISEMAPKRFATPLSFVIELLAAVPSIIYGLWALFVFRFWVRDLIEAPLHQAFGDTIPLFAKTPFGLDIFTAGIVLAIMIIPTVSSISRELMRAVPNAQREAAYSLGATRWETLRMAIFPYAKSGLFGAAILGLGRAVGETMLVTMVIGNAIGISAIPNSLFSPSQTLASLIANEFNEAVTPFHTSALIGLGVVLFVLTLSINIGARVMVSKIQKTARVND